MSLFFLVFFALYGGLHIYAFIKARVVIGFGTGTAVLLALFMAVMVIAPILVRILEKQGLETAAWGTAAVGYLWMGIIFIFFSVSLVFDIYSLLMHGIGALSGKNLAALIPAQRTAFYISLAWTTIGVLYGLFEARSIRTEHVVIPTPKIPRSVGTVRVVQVSDVHVGLIVREARLGRIVEAVRQAKPDLLVSTGDLVDGQLSAMTGLADMLGQIKPKHGTYAITGNHEFYAGLDQALDFTRRSGFRILRGETADVGGFMTIAGVDDPVRTRMQQKLEVAEHELLKRTPRDRFTLLLKHRPSVAADSAQLFDLQLSGHVHKGQIFPFNILTHLFYPVKMGLSRPTGSGLLYVSRGSGTWGPPIRLFAPPEVTVFELVPQ